MGRTIDWIPMTSAAACASARLRFTIVGPDWRWCPDWPLVTETKAMLWPSFAHRAAVPEARTSQSSGCAPMIMMLRGLVAMVIPFSQRLLEQLIYDNSQTSMANPSLIVSNVLCGYRLQNLVGYVFWQSVADEHWQTPWGGEYITPNYIMGYIHFLWHIYLP